MGNSNQKLETFLKNDKNYSITQTSMSKKNQEYPLLDQVVGSPILVKAKNFDIQLEQYRVLGLSNLPIQQDCHIYKLRSSSYSKNIAVVFEHQILDQRQRNFVVRTQKMVCRLNQIQHLTSIQALIIVEQALNGFVQILHHQKIPFLVSDKMIAINETCQVRVWVNQNFAVNMIQQYSSQIKEKDMIASIEDSVIKHISADHFLTYKTCCSDLKKYNRLVDARNSLTKSLLGLNKRQIFYHLTQKYKLKRIKNKNLIDVQKHNDISNMIKSQMRQQRKQFVCLESEQFQKRDEAIKIQKYDRISKNVQFYGQQGQNNYIDSPTKQNIKSYQNPRIIDKILGKVFNSNQKSVKQSDYIPHSKICEQSENLYDEKQIECDKPPKNVKVIQQKQQTLSNIKMNEQLNINQQNKNITFNYAHQPNYPTQKKIIRHSIEITSPKNHQNNCIQQNIQNDKIPKYNMNNIQKHRIPLSKPQNHHKHSPHRQIKYMNQPFILKTQKGTINTHKLTSQIIFSNSLTNQKKQVIYSDRENVTNPKKPYKVTQNSISVQNKNKEYLTYAKTQKYDFYN